MNKQIKQLLENLFDDYDDIIQDDNIENDSIAKKICEEDIKKNVKEWLRYNIASSSENNNIDRNLTLKITTLHLNILTVYFIAIYILMTI